MAMLLSSVAANAYDFEVDGIYYNIISTTDLTVKVTSGDNKYTGNIIIPSNVTYKSKTLSVTSIESAAFSSCNSLTSITIPNSVTSIGNSAFSSCSSLTSITIPNSVTSIGESAFKECKSLTSITIPNSVTSIKTSTFRGCSSLASIRIPNSVKSVGESAFFNCLNLKELIIEDDKSSLEVSYNYSASGIKAALFNDCKKLERVYLGRNLNYKNVKPFEDLGSLKSLIIGKNVTTIINCGFESCSGLASIFLLGTIPPYASNSFRNSHYINTAVYVPRGSLYTYQSADNWKNFWDIKTVIKTQPTAENLLIELNCSEESVEYQWYKSVGEYIYTKEIIPTSTGDFAWTESDDIWTSGNWGKSQTKSIMTAIVDVQIGDTISFDYTVPAGASSSSNWFAFCVNGDVKLKAFDGDTISSSHYELPINEFVFERWLKGDTIATLSFECVRYGNSDHATVSNIKHIRPTGFPTGEVIDEKIVGATTAILDETMFIKGGIAYCVATLHNFEDMEITLISDKVRVPSYTLTYVIDGEVYYKDTLRYKAKIIPPNMPVKEGYTFSGWSEIPATMPANDIVIEGSYILDTAIGRINIDFEKCEVYNLKGQRITESDNLTRGIYIINGNKTFVK